MIDENILLSRMSCTSITDSKRNFIRSSHHSAVHYRRVNKVPFSELFPSRLSLTGHVPQRGPLICVSHRQSVRLCDVGNRIAMFEEKIDLASNIICTWCVKAYSVRAQKTGFDERKLVLIIEIKEELLFMLENIHT